MSTTESKKQQDTKREEAEIKAPPTKVQKKSAEEDTPTTTTGAAAAPAKPTTDLKEDVKIVWLDDLTETQTQQLKAISQDAEVMKWVGDTKPWAASRVKELADWSRADRLGDPKQKQPPYPAEKRCYFSWACVAGGEGEDKRVVGFVGLHPLDKRAKPPVLQLRFFVSRQEQRKGFGKAAVKEALKAYKHEMSSSAGANERKLALWALVRKGNQASSALLKSAGFRSAGEKTIGHEVEDAFLIDL